MKTEHFGSWDNNIETNDLSPCSSFYLFVPECTCKKIYNQRYMTYGIIWFPGDRWRAAARDTPVEISLLILASVRAMLKTLKSMICKPGVELYTGLPGVKFGHTEFPRPAVEISH